MFLLRKTYVKYALYMCIVLVICLFLMTITGTTFDTKSPIMAFATFVSPFIIWFLGIKNRKKELKGKMTFKQGVAFGFKISLVFGIISPFIFAAYYLIDPSILEFIKDAYQMPQASDGAIMAIDMTAQFLSAIIFGTIYSAIISFFLKTKKAKSK